MICEQCHQREATCHSTTVNDDGGAISTSLCEECFASSAEPEVREFYLAGKSARCKFCGGPAVCGGMDALTLLGEERPMSFLCGRCAKEMYRYLQQQLEHMSPDSPQEEQMAQVKALLKEAELHMKKWVMDRDSDSGADRKDL